MAYMVLLSLLLSAAALPIAAAVCFGIAALARRLGYRPAAERLTAKDRRWLTEQGTSSPTDSRPPDTD